MNVEKRNQQFIDKLHPKIRDAVKYALIIINDPSKLGSGRSRAVITFGLRTFAEQQALYDQGRSKPGQIVTNAKPGQSFHNYGLAIDIALWVDDKVMSWDTKADFNQNNVADWMEVVGVMKNAGLDWGGDWRTFKDLPHFQLNEKQCPPWQVLKQLVDKKKVDKDGYVIF